MYLIIVLQLAVCHAKLVKSFIVEPIVLCSHPAGFLSTIKLCENLFTAVQFTILVRVLKYARNIGDAISVSTSSSPAISVQFQCLENTSHHRIFLSKIIPSFYESTIKSSILSVEYSSMTSIRARISLRTCTIFYGNIHFANRLSRIKALGSR